MTTAVETRSLVKTFGSDIHAVRGVDIRVEPGELTVLVGPSGCGKTTTLRMIAGLERVTSGEIYVGDRLVNRVHPAKRGVALVFQNFALYPHKTAYQNMAFPLESERTPKEDVKRRVGEVAEMLELAEHLNKRPAELSGGQQQRVSLGRALVRNPDVLLLDEPLSNLDARLRVMMRSELKRIQRAVGSTSIYVTHDQVEAMTMGDRIVVMHEGLVAQTGTPQDVYLTPQSVPVARTIGSPAMNMLDAEPVIQDDEVALRGLQWELRIDGEGADLLRRRLADLSWDSRLVVGIRPGDIDMRDPQDSSEPVGGATLVRGTCVTAEPLGSETLYTVDIGQQVVQFARRDTHVMLAEGETTQLYVAEKGYVHVFDAATGERLAGVQRLRGSEGWKPYTSSSRLSPVESGAQGSEP